MNEALAVKRLNAASDRIGGYSGALAFLDGLPDAMARKVLKPAMKAADLVGMEAAQAEMAKHDTARPKNGVHMSSTAGAAEAVLGSAVIGKVGYFGQGGSAAWLVEHGHRIVIGGTVARISGKRKGQSPYAKNKANTGKGTVVGQAPPHPVLAPAYAESKDRMEQAFAAECIHLADKEATRLAKQVGSI
jgi:hypothetical protein